MTDQTIAASQEAYIKLSAVTKRIISDAEQLVMNLGRSSAEIRLMGAAMQGIPLQFLEEARQQVVLFRHQMAEATQESLNMAEQEKRFAAERSLIDGLQNRSDAIGKSIADILEMQAMSQRLVDESTLYITNLRNQESALRSGGGAFNEYKDAVVATIGAVHDLAQIMDSLAALREGKLTQTFGAAIPAVQALGGILMGMVTPVSVAAAAVAALGVAAYSGSQEMKELQTHLTMTGGSLGVTSDQVSDMAARLDALDGVTRNRAVEALTEIAKTGRISGEQLELVGEVALRANQILGKEIETTVNEFSKLAEDPTQAAVKLNNTYNFLTTSVYDQIRALEEQGNKQDAARLAQETYASVTNERLREVGSQLGYVERGWNLARNAVKEYWDAAMGVGRPATVSEQIQGYEDDIRTNTETLEDFGFSALSTFAQIDKAMISENAKGAAKGALGRIDEAHERIARLMREDAGADFTAGAQAWGTNEIKRRHAAMDEWSKIHEGNLSRQTKIEIEIARIRETGIAAGKSELEIEGQIAAYRERNKQTGAAGRGDAAMSMLESMRQQEVLLRTQLSGTDQLMSSQVEMASLEQRIADIKGKQIRTADDLSILAAEDRLRMQLETNVALEKELQTREDVQKFQQRAAQVHEQMSLARDNQNEQYQRRLDSFDVAGKTMERQQSQHTIYKEFEAYQVQLSSDVDLGVVGQEFYREESDKIQTELQRRLAMDRSYYDEVDRRQASWSLGARQGLIAYADEASNVFQNVSSLATMSFQGMEDALVQFVLTGKLSFSDLANSIVQDMVRIAVQQSITAPLAGALGNLMKGWFSPSVSMPTGGISPGSSGTGFTGTGGLGLRIPNALGGVYDSSSLSQFSDGVYSSPKQFDFAKGVGVFAEAGTEAIMPLSRSTDGRLGVRAELPRMHAGQASEPQINVNIQGASGAPEVTASRDQSGNLNIDLIWKQVSKQMAGEMVSGQGQFVRSMERRYALTPKLG
ncbi:MAG: phage tail tape measure protein [Corticimicrobacter sp.]|uniref:phage tail tape measure protein n=1 Tax=Corticimicrobacter sp. TaxID=2678536 RepID=UPI0032DA2F01